MSDEAAKLFAGHIGVCAVLADVLIDKGVISQSELYNRFQQAHVAACQSSAGPAVAHALSEMIEYLEPTAGTYSAASATKRRLLVGQTILLIERDETSAREMQGALELAGAEVLTVREAADALPRIAQFDFSAAVLEWRPHCKENLAIARLLKEDGIRFVYHAEQPPEDVITARGAPILLKPANADDIVSSLALLINAEKDEERRELEAVS
jgi:CheY-like chemotaxis protein